MSSSVQELKASLNLQPHPEGGFFSEVYRSKQEINTGGLCDGLRSFCTHIYFLVTGGNFSGWHRIKQDELWHFYASSGGTGLQVHVIDKETGEYSIRKLGLNLQEGERPHLVVRGGDWFASCLPEEVVAREVAKGVSEESVYALVGCTVSPGFDMQDLELPTREHLVGLYPQHRDIITRLTRT